MRLQIEVVVRRGAIAESRHHIQAVACDAAGRALAATDGAGHVTTFRSAAKLGLARAEGWTLEGYERAAHPVQQLMRRTVAEVCGMSPEAVEVAVDGCGVSVFGVPLTAMARGYATFAAARPEDGARAGAL